MVKVGGKTQVEVAELFNVDRSTISRLVSERRVRAQGVIVYYQSPGINMGDPFPLWTLH